MSTDTISPQRRRIRGPVPFRPVTQTPVADDWRSAGHCVGSDPELWFSSDEELSLFAADICSECPVRRECLAWAISAGVSDGIWGGRDFGRDQS